eukprot:398451_1
MSRNYLWSLDQNNNKLYVIHRSLFCYDLITNEWELLSTAMALNASIFNGIHHFQCIFLNNILCVVCSNQYLMYRNNRFELIPHSHKLNDIHSIHIDQDNFMVFSNGLIYNGRLNGKNQIKLKIINDIKLPSKHYMLYSITCVYDNILLIILYDNCKILSMTILCSL